MGRNTVVKYLFFAMFFVIFGLLLFADTRISYTFRAETLLHNLEILPVIVFLVGILIFFILFVKRHAPKWKAVIERRYIIILSGLCVLLFAAQLFLAENIKFLSGWDCTAVRNFAFFESRDPMVYAANGNLYTYYSRYENNLFLPMVLRTVRLLFPFYKDGAINDLFIGMCALSMNLSTVLTTLSIWKITGSKGISLIGFLLFALLFGLSPWIVIPYSDIFAVFFISATLFVYLCMKRNKTDLLRWALLGMLVFTGIRIKPTVAIVLIAIVIREIWLLRAGRKFFRLPMCSAAVLVGCYFTVMLLYMGGLRYYGVTTDKEKNYTMTHFLLMGMNRDSGGAYSPEDVLFSSSIAVKKERQLNELQKTVMRIREMGPMGLVTFFSQKLLMTYNDGTFFWGGEGNFYLEVPEAKSAFSKVLRSYFYRGGTNYEYFRLVTKILWLMTLLLIFGNLFGKDDERISVIYLSLLGLTVFLLLFEARARYLLCYAPVFMVCAMTGFCKILRKAEFLCNKKSPRAKKPLGISKF